MRVVLAVKRWYRDTVGSVDAYVRDAFPVPQYIWDAHDCQKRHERYAA